MPLFIIFLTAVGLSMDAFSLSLIYGTLNMSKKTNRSMSIMVGIFHFFMPILGYFLGTIILKYIPVNPDTLVGIIFIILSIEMMISLTKDEQVKILTSFLSVCFFAFTVSIDSFSVGIAFGTLKNNIYISSIIFSVISALFTYTGVTLGKKLVKNFGGISTLIGSIILLFLGISYLI